jgi:hypothetical protein
MASKPSNTKPIRIHNSTYESLAGLAVALNQPMTAVLDNAVNDLKRQVFLVQVNEGYAKLRQDPLAWSEFQREATEWDGTLGDGLA